MRMLTAVLGILIFSGICLAKEKSPSLEKSVVMVDGKTFVPLLEMADWMGAKVSNKDGKLFVVRGKRVIKVNEQESFLVHALRLETYIDKQGKKRQRIVSVPFTMVSLRFLADAMDYTIEYRTGVVVVENNNKRVILTPVSYIDLNFLGFRGRGKYGNFSFPISGGRKKYPVPEGWFWVYIKHKDHKSSQWPKPNGGAPMPYSLFFYRGSAIHVGSLNIPSHSCVHVTKKDAKKLFEQVSLYTLVCIRKNNKDV